MNRHILMVLFVFGALHPQASAETQEVAAMAMLEWNEVFLDAIKTQNSAPGLASRNLAILHIAIFDALNAREKKYRPVAFTGSSSLEPDSDFGTVCGAGRECALLLYPSERARFNRLFKRQEATAGDAFVAGVALGRLSAKAILRMRDDDGASRSVTYIPSDQVGQWRRTPPKFRPPELPHWAGVRPFALEGASQFRPPPPPAIDSAIYLEGWQDVKALGDRTSKSRTKDQAEVANFWSCFNYTATPAGHWNDIARKVIDPLRYDVVDLARCYALLNIAMADAGIAAWDCKYHYRFWRPIQAIPQADNDGNDWTEASKDWKSLLEAPPHPEYVSGHSAFTGAGEAVLKTVLGRDDVKFEASSDSVPGVIRRYESLSACAEEIGRSRIYGGIHFQWSNTEGLSLGRKVAAEVVERCCSRADVGAPKE